MTEQEKAINDAGKSTNADSCQLDTVVRHAYQDWCKVIAFLINSDNLFFRFTEKEYTGEMVFNYNSHGELFGLLSVIGMFEKAIKENIMVEYCQVAIAKILNGETILPEKTVGAGWGMMAITLLYKCKPNFENDAFKMLALANPNVIRKCA
jgi:hypothetical protein